MSTPIRKKTAFSETTANVSRSSTLVAGSPSTTDPADKNLPPTPTLMGTLKRAPTVENVNSFLSNSVLQNSLQLLEQIAAVGQVMPYVAPAFALLKFILEIEQRAKDVDAKCTDLLERINFMLGHLPTLKEVKVNDATKQVIERMNHALKVAALVIQAYRTQGAIARRLNLGNKDKFIACADAINKCTQDLMTSLQIHQSQQLDILTRPVPIDPVDTAAESFMNSHGGEEAVKNDPSLVMEFARAVHLTLDDESLKQINSNITENMLQSQDKLEKSVSSSAINAVKESLYEIATQHTESEKQPSYTCVQCEKEYKESTNGDQTCSYHKAECDSWTKKYPCCGDHTPCRKGRHREKHHSDYPYATFFPRVWKLTGHTDTLEKWAEVEDANLEKDSTESALVARVVRWASRTEKIAAPILLVKVGTVEHTNPYFFDTFTPDELRSIAGEILVGTRKSLIFRTSESETEYSLAEWVLAQGKMALEGVRLTAKAATSPLPTTILCPIDPVELKMPSEVFSISEGGLRAYTPQSEYVLPPTLRTGPVLPDGPVREVRTDFKTRTTDALPLVLKSSSTPPLKANARWASSDRDIFSGSVTVFNKQPTSASEPITIAKVSALYRLVGEAEYTPAVAVAVEGHDKLPVTLQPRQTWNLEFRSVVMRTPEDALLGEQWNMRAFCARKRPLRLKLVLEDIEGNECSLVIEYVFRPYLYEQQRSSDLAFFFFDDPDYYERYHLHVTKPSIKGRVICFGNSEVEVKTLKKIVYKALKNGETEVELPNIAQKKNKWMYQVFALVDVSCVRVYAFKVVMKQVDTQGRKAKYGCIGYVPCPEYGDVLKVTRPVRYATETVMLEAHEYQPPPYEMDDTVDDWVPPPPAPSPPAPQGDGAAPSANDTSTRMVMPPELFSRLASIDGNLARIATAMERFLEVTEEQNRRAQMYGGRR